MVIGVPKPLPWDGFFSKADNFIMCVTSILVAGTTLILTNALVWVVLGSLIRPADLIPYAIMVAAVATMGHSMLSKFRGMKNYCQSQMVDLLDAALVAIFKVMAKDKTMMSTVEDRKEKFEALKDQVAKLLPDLDLHVGKAMEKMVRAGRHREGTDEFLSKLHLDPEAGTQTQVVPATAQAATDAKVEAQDSQAGELHMQPATASAEHKSADKERERKVKKLSKHLALHSKTVELMLDCFENRVVLKRLSDNAAAHSNSSASTLASLVSIARRDCLFGHFLRPLEAPGLPKDAPETEPRVLSLLCHLQNEEMERMDAVVAKCLTQYLNWPRIGREVEFFCSRTLVSRVILNAVERELSVVVQGSAASEVVLGAYRVGYELFETRYRTKPLEIFADCGLLDPDVLQRPQVQFILNAEIDAQLHGGGLTPGALIAAVRSLCLHGEEKSLMPGSQPKAYFWYKGLVAVLKDLGWSREELEPSKGWLQNRWDELTERCDLFEYSSAEEVVALVLRLTNGGLWKAATKSLLLKTGICGYASCHGAAEKAGKLAKELDACDILDLTFVSQKCHWPADVTKLWEEHACASSPEGPVVLPVSQVMRFMEALVYDLAEEKTEESGKEARRFLPLSPFSESMEDLAWQKELGRSPGLWHVQPSGRRKLRGLWLELVIQVFDVMDCIPTDLDLFFQCQEATTTLGDVSFMLQLDKFKEWLKRDYFSQLTDCTFNQFKVIVRDMLKCHIPEKALMEQVFEACPVIPDDDKGELRAISDLAAALYAYTDHGLWSEALRLVAKRLLPAGNSRDYALTHLEDEFEATDVAKRGVLSVMESLDLLQNLAVPGLTCADLGKLLEKELGLEVPRAELHKYFTTMDVNGDGLLQDEEFIQVVRFLMLDYYPHHILKHLNLSLPQIALFMSGVLAAIGVVFLLVTLVISFFEVGEDIGATLHGGFSGIFGVVGKRLSDEGIGFEDTMKNLELRLEAMMVTALVTVLGLSKEMQDVFSNVIASAEARLV
ncbi:Pdia3 [Symbiodinium sp. CCMP2456]|nr:Pdia3 [Symbiodinium sp. CCMP2456]